MSKRKIFIEFSGRASLRRDYQENNNKEESHIVEKLNVNNRDIKYEIISALEDISHNKKINIVDLDIYFTEGSIEWQGAVTIIEWGALISGNIALLQFFVPRLKHAINKVIRRRIPSSYQYITTTATPAHPQDQVDLSGDNWSINSKKALIFITVLNLLIFCGGSFLNAVHVPSILERFEESKQKLAKASTLLSEKEKDINSLTKQLNDSLKKIEKDLKKTDEKLKTVNTNINNIDEKTKQLNKLVERYEKRINSFSKAKSPINFKDLWELSAWSVRILLGVLTFLSLLCTFFLYKVVRKKA